MDFPLFGEEVVEWEGDELKKMKSLKTLIIKNGRFSKGPKYLPNSLRVLEWHRYPFPNIPSDFWPKKLSICKLPENCLTSFEIPGSLNTLVMIYFYHLVCISMHHIKITHFFFFLFSEVRKYERHKFGQMSMFNTDI